MQFAQADEEEPTGTWSRRCRQTRIVRRAQPWAMSWHSSPSRITY